MQLLYVVYNRSQSCIKRVGEKKSLELIQEGRGVINLAKNQSYKK
jgi:hypothetical protein